MQKIQLNILSVFFGIPTAIVINIITEYIFIVDNGNCYEYRFPKLSWLLDFFYDGYHYDTNLFNFLLTLLLGTFIVNRLIKIIIRIISKK